MSTPTLERRPTHKAFPLLRSEISRISHRRLFRVLSILFLLGILLVSGIAFLAHHEAPEASGDELTQVYEKSLQRWERCVDQLPSDLTAEEYCGPEPTIDTVDPYVFREDTRYKAYEDLPFGLVATILVAAAVSFVIGASSGGAEWSSRSMTLQLLFEPRRLRLLTIKWLGLVTATSALAAVAMLLTVGLGAATASLRGTWDSRYTPQEIYVIRDALWSSLTFMGLRGIALTAIAATFGYAIAMLVRNTGAALGAAFVYFALVEIGVRVVFFKYGSEPFMLTTNSATAIIPGGVDIPGAELPSGGNENVHVSNLRAMVTLLVYAVVLSIPAAWSFTRRDVS